MRELIIDGRTINDANPCYVVAEIGNNHGGSFDAARDLIQLAKWAGADAVKFQKRQTETLYTPALLNQPYCNEHSYGSTYGAHRTVLEFGPETLAGCQQVAKDAKITCFATAFDEPSADVLMALQVPAIKLASGSLTDTALLRYVSSLGVPLILSTGGGTHRDIDMAVQILTARQSQVALLHCTAAYPVRDFTELNLRCITTLRAMYPTLVIGWSGHDSGIAMAVVAYTLGARIIEKHVTLNRANKGTDQAWSLEPSGLKKLVRDLGRAREAMGDGVKRVYESEKAPIRKMRRTLQEDGRWQIG